MSEMFNNEELSAERDQTATELRNALAHNRMLAEQLSSLRTALDIEKASNQALRNANNSLRAEAETTNILSILQKAIAPEVQRMASEYVQSAAFKDSIHDEVISVVEVLSGRVLDDLDLDEEIEKKAEEADVEGYLQTAIEEALNNVRISFR